ncbi:MAG TPA: hypothetical protein VI749_03650 [Candidatus Omnitrophota bacterium]|nr:hypothetical protein [Candidatus Omnitrophota bacterium]
MAVIITVIVLLMVGAIIYLKRPSQKEIKTRDEFLSELVEFVEGKLEPLEGFENSFKISFNFEGHSLVYEDMELPGFKAKSNKCFLKAPVPQKFDLQFQEKEQSAKIIQSNAPAYGKGETHRAGGKVELPSKLKRFDVSTNDYQLANRFLSQAKVVQILGEYDNVDFRGNHFIAIKIIRGEIILEFYTEGRYHPNLGSVKNNIHLFDDHIKNVLTLKKILGTLS